MHPAPRVSRRVPESFRFNVPLPGELAGKTVSIGNTAEEGARMVLTNSGRGDEIQEILERLKAKELSIPPDFQEYFVRHLSFPGGRKNRHREIGRGW